MGLVWAVPPGAAAAVGAEPLQARHTVPLYTPSYSFALLVLQRARTARSLGQCRPVRSRCRRSQWLSRSEGQRGRSGVPDPGEEGCPPQITRPLVVFPPGTAAAMALFNAYGWGIKALLLLFIAIMAFSIRWVRDTGPLRPPRRARSAARQLRAQSASRLSGRKQGEEQPSTARSPPRLRRAQRHGRSARRGADLEAGRECPAAYPDRRRPSHTPGCSAW
jgi:hypothetical protein